MKVAERHAQIDNDHLVELKRRCQLWATCPGDDGGALEPEAQIVPLVTLRLAVEELEGMRKMVEEWKVIADKITKAKARGSA
jgi:hypothetical protein